MKSSISTFAPPSNPAHKDDRWSGPAILIAAFTGECRQALTSMTQSLGLHPLICGSVAEARRITEGNRIAVIFCEAVLADGTARDLLVALRAAKWPVPVVVASSAGDWDDYSVVMQLGAFDFMIAPYRPGDVAQILRYACRCAAWGRSDFRRAA